MENPKKKYRLPAPRPSAPLSDKVKTWFGSRGISERTLLDMRISEGSKKMPQTGTEMNTVQFCYYLEGKLINIKYRTGDKKFMMESGAELIPYNIDSVRDSDTCIVTEGEIDALSFVEIGRKDVISVPAGASNNSSYLDRFIDEYFENKKRIYIASDTDSKGLVLRDELLRRFGAHRCFIVSYGEGCKDANEHLVKYGKQSLAQCLANAQEVVPDGVYCLKDYEKKIDAIFAHGLKRGMIIGHPQFDAICSFETKRLCVVTGIPSSGKSEFIDEMCIRLNLFYGLKCAFFSPENLPLELHAIKLLEKLSGRKVAPDDGHHKSIGFGDYIEAKEYYADNFFHILPTEKYTLDAVLASAEYLVRRRGIRILVIDPYNRLENEQDSRETETQYISRVLDRLTIFAQQNDALVFLMAHPKKVAKDNGNGGVPTFYDIAGSAHFFNKTDYGIIVHRDMAAGNTLVRVEKVKFRHLGQKGDVRFGFNTDNGRYISLDTQTGMPLAPQNDSLLDFVRRGGTPETSQKDVFDFSQIEIKDVPF
ncbi:MAG: toprim domain-containing protein [Muribaculaceae bacterium]|nr:toprim domain-containing protein [Muribaculaceae bacterium]